MRVSRGAVALSLLFFAVFVGMGIAGGDKHPSQTYLDTCAKCHGEDGTGNTPKGKKLKARDFTDPKFQEKISDAAIAQMIKEGRERDGKILMPPFGSMMSKDDIATLISDVRAFGKK